MFSSTSEGSAPSHHLAEPSVELIRPKSPGVDLLLAAGAYMKRFDPETGAFVSNIKEEYPDD